MDIKISYYIIKYEYFMRYEAGDEKKMKHTISFKDIIALQCIVVIYTFSTICAKFASAEEPLSIRFFLFLGLEFVILAVYAVCWQQMIKKFELSIAYTNRSLALMWSMLWSILFFKEKISIQNIIGIIIVMFGVVLINLDGLDRPDGSADGGREAAHES